MVGRKRKKGVWIKLLNENYYPFGDTPEYWYLCSKCSCKQDIKPFKYCPECGTRMEVQNDL